MLTKIFGWLTSEVVGTVTSSLNEAYQAKLNAETNEKKLEADITITQLEAQQALLIAEQNRRMTSWIRPAIAAPVVIYIWKLLVWDTVLQLGTTPNPGEIVNWIVVTVIGAYLVTRPFERK